MISNNLPKTSIKHRRNKDKEQQFEKGKEQFQTMMFWKQGLAHMGKYMNGEDYIPHKEKKTNASGWNYSRKPRLLDTECVTLRIGYEF